MEDNPGDVRLIRERIVDLEGIRPELVHVGSLGAALERLRADPPDLVLLDLNLPDSHDIGTVRTVVEAAPTVPVIVLTGRKEGEAATRALRLGAQDYLVKDEITGPLLERSIRYAVQRKAAGEEVRWHERRFRALAESAPDAIVTIDTESRIVYANPAVADVFGYEAEELVGAALTRLMPEDMADRHTASLGRYLATGERHLDWSNVQMPARRADGERFRVEISFSEYTIGDDRYFTGIIRDITDRMELQQELTRQRARFEEVFEDAPAFIATLRGPDHVFEMANPAYREMVGDRELVGRPVLEAFPELLEAGWWEILDRVYHTGEPFETHEEPVEIQIGDGDGTETRYLNFSYLPREDEGVVTGILVLGMDVTEQVEARRQARRSETILSRTLETMAEGIMLADAEGTFHFVNAAAARMLDRDADDIVGTNYNAESWRITAPDGGPFPDRELPVARVLRTGEAVHEVEHAVNLPDGSRIVLSVNAAPVEGIGGGSGVVASIRDVTERKQFEAQLEHRALHDYLTGLPNRALLRDRLDHALDRSRRTGEKLAVLFVDLDRFKTVNDSLGHETGDRVLEEVARRLQGGVRDRDTVARVGGDEFTILLEDVTDEEAARETAERLMGELSAPIELAQDRIQLDASVGIALHDPGRDVGLEAVTSTEVRGTHLIRRADRAMFRVKELAGRRIALADDEDDADLRQELSREMRLREAIEAGRLSTVYQPVFDLESGRPVGAEALARWTDGELGEVSPGEFIPIAEKTGLIVPLGEQQMERACRDAGTWPASRYGGPGLRVHVNLSARQLSNPELLDRIRDVLERTGCPPARLEFEITESAAMHEARMVDRLKELDVGLSVDDFGTRYSTLAQLKRLNVDALKIDRSFVRSLTEDRRDRAIVEATLVLGRAMGLRVVAEGIETEEQLALLREMGCREGQGFGLARPMDREAFARWLAEDPEI